MMEASLAASRWQVSLSSSSSGLSFPLGLVPAWFYRQCPGCCYVSLLCYEAITTTCCSWVPGTFKAGKELSAWYPEGRGRRSYLVCLFGSQDFQGLIRRRGSEYVTSLVTENGCLSHKKMLVMLTTSPGVGSDTGHRMTLWTIDFSVNN